MVEMQWHSQTKERDTENTNFNLHRPDFYNFQTRYLDGL